MKLLAKFNLILLVVFGIGGLIISELALSLIHILVNPDLEQYKIIGAREIPDIDVRLVEAYIGQRCV